MASLKILIVGGGITGPAAAYWLSRIGANVTIIERSTQRRASGQQVDLRGNGVLLMRKMGIESAVRAVTVKESGTQLIDTKGNTKAFFPAFETGGATQGITSEFEIMRGDLVNILYGLTEGKPNVKHLYGTTIDTLNQDDESRPDGKVHVTFNDGQKEDFDLVIGADGTGSKTRKMMLGPDAPDPRCPMGGYIAFFSVPSKAGDPDRFTFCHLPSTRVSRIISTRKDCPDLTRVYMFIYGHSETIEAAHKSKDINQLKTAWADLYQDGPWECPRFTDALRHSPEADDIYCTRLDSVRLPKGDWSRGRIALVGDAAYSHGVDGYGVTWGLMGAYILAGEIAKAYAKNSSSPTAAVIEGAKQYEEQYRPIAAPKESGSNWIHSMLFPRSSLGISFLHICAGLMARLRLDQRVEREDSTSKWKLPEYPELEKEL